MAYQKALEQYNTSQFKKKQNDSKVGDFTPQPAREYSDGPEIPFETFIDADQWISRVKACSEPFLANSHVVEGTANLNAVVERKYFVSSEGAKIVQNRTYVYLTINGSIRTEDGDVVDLHKSYFAFAPEGIPSQEIILRDVKEMVGKLEKLRVAPVAEPYTGPAILNSYTSGVFFHEIFGHRMEGHRFRDTQDGHTFKDKIGHQVLPAGFSVTSDPTLKTFGSQDMNGYYVYDDEGVPAARVKLVEGGVLKTFLMSRAPLQEVSESNGHGRSQPGFSPVSRQSNLIVSNKKTVSTEELRKMLLKACKKQKKPYGYLFQDVIGGFTTTDRYMPNSFDIFPTEVYRVYADGRPDELVRGVDLIGTPLSMFAEIKASDSDAQVFTGFCGAESGLIPVTTVAPALFVNRIETQKKPVLNESQPLISKPE